MLTFHQLVVFGSSESSFWGGTIPKDSPFCILRFCEASEKVYRLTGARWFAMVSRKEEVPIEQDEMILQRSILNPKDL